MRTGIRLILAALPLGAVALLPSAADARPMDWPWPRHDAGDPFTMTVEDVGCRSGRVAVRLHNQTRQLARFDLKSDGDSVASGSIPARKTIVRQVA
ncbi:hypothetical protein ACWEPC_57130, partial [Nonomuraea sp. NPDC004297]